MRLQCAHTRNQTEEHRAAWLVEVCVLGAKVQASFAEGRNALRIIASKVSIGPGTRLSTPRLSQRRVRMGASVLSDAPDNKRVETALTGLPDS